MEFASRSRARDFAAQFTGWRRLYIPLHIPGHWVGVVATRASEDSRVTLLVANPLHSCNGRLAEFVDHLAAALSDKCKLAPEINYFNGAQQPDGSACGAYIITQYYYLIVYGNLPVQSDFAPHSDPHLTARVVRYFATNIALHGMVTDALSSTRPHETIALEDDEDDAPPLPAVHVPVGLWAFVNTPPAPPLALDITNEGEGQG